MKIIYSFIFVLYLSIHQLTYGQPKDSTDRDLLNDERVNPQFANLIRQFLDSAVKRGFNPVVHEAFRSKERALQLNQVNKKLGLAAAAVSVHSFGMAVDIWLKNDKGEAFSFDPKGIKSNPLNRFSFRIWMNFIKIGESFGLINAYEHGDTDHWEYHPNWNKNDWINAKKVAYPIYEQYKELTERKRLEKVWSSAGLSF